MKPRRSRALRDRVERNWLNLRLWFPVRMFRRTLLLRREGVRDRRLRRLGADWNDRLIADVSHLRCAAHRLGDEVAEMERAAARVAAISQRAGRIRDDCKPLTCDDLLEGPGQDLQELTLRHSHLDRQLEGLETTINSM